MMKAVFIECVEVGKGGGARPFAFSEIVPATDVAWATCLLKQNSRTGEKDRMAIKHNVDPDSRVSEHQIEKSLTLRGSFFRL